MEGMEAFPDKFFDLAIVDPPYGVGQHFNFRFGRDENSVYKNEAPTKEYWEQLFRVSKQQIVWGGNYFTNYLPVSRCWISWYKGQPINSFSDFELAWTSFDQISKAVKLESYGFNHADRRHTKQPTIHPTQKPISLYMWLLSNYANPGNKIFDSHLGGGSSRIASFKMGFDFWAFEIDEDYFRDQEKRFKEQTAQIQLFT